LIKPIVGGSSLLEEMSLEAAAGRFLGAMMVNGGDE
jgi:hypothetical protein